MRYDADHKARSRARILEAARVRIRREGPKGASIDRVMGDAGLTRGSFYAHFASKEELIETVMAIDAGLIGDVSKGRARQALANYLQPAGLSQVAANCPLVAHPVDAIRCPSLGPAYGAQLNGLIEALGDDDSAVEAAVLAVGAALLTNAAQDDRLTERIHRVVSRRLDALLE